MSTTDLTGLIQSAPVHRNSTTYDLTGILEAFDQASVAAESVLTVSQCKFGTANIEALVDGDTLAFIHPGGVLCTTGGRKFFSKTVQFDTIDFAMCRAWGDVEHADERGFGKFGIEFAGPGNVLLGRLYWSWRAKRFRDPRDEIMAVAGERDRIQGVIGDLLR